MAEIAERLRNWGNWLRTARAQAHAYSAEGMYRAPDWEADLGQRPRAPHYADAWDMELAARMLPIPHHLLLKLRYVSACSDDVIFAVVRKQTGRRLTSTDLYALEAMATVRMIEALTLPQDVRRHRALVTTQCRLEVPALHRAFTKPKGLGRLADCGITEDA